MAAKFKKQVSEFHSAIRNNDMRAVEQVMRSSNALEMCQAELHPRGTSLHVAAECACPEIVQLLLTSGISANQRQEGGHVVSGATPLMAAACAGKADNVEVLLSKGADVHLPDSDGLTALHCACQGSDKLAVVQTLVKHGADVNAKDSRGQCPLQVSILRAPTEVSKYLIDQGADVHVADKDGQSTLHYAAEWDNADLVRILVEKGADVNLQDNFGKSPLHVTSEDEIMQILIQNGGDVTLRDANGRPPVEGHIDTNKEEIKHINEVLGRRQEKMKQNEGQPLFHGAKATEVQERFNKLVVDAADGESRSGLLSELQTKVKRYEDEEGGADIEAKSTSRKYKPSPLATAGVLTELKATKKPTAED